MRSKIEIVRDIVINHQYEKVSCRGKKILLDVQTAHRILRVHDTIKPENQKKLMACEWPAIVHIVNKTLEKKS